MADAKVIAEHLKSWLAHDGWHSGHALDENRFLKAVKDLNITVGTDWSEQDFEDAVYLVLGEKARDAFESFVQDYTNIALHLRDYEKLA
ncbi:hypothetical protein [Cupriavidus sp. AcVe19-6a]|uniref:hypothetical protein n=1 Tax=Cupriavidus sp. AcVe19-6a TaxID=2821358 RepID=UPI001AE19490|nr:hypothetical protein [Cupriavidus sp. AcVe19-6a]MBP0639131.1 hypothetical protein [Cupriavidus sp. AcVe19-6a]